MAYKPSLEQYIEIDTELKFITDRLQSVRCVVNAEIGKSKSPSKRLLKISEELDKCRSELGELMNFRASTPQERREHLHSPKFD